MAIIRSIDKNLVREFYEVDKPTSKHTDELLKVADIVLLKYFPKMYMFHKDMKQFALIKSYDEKKKYDGRKDAYNYTFTMYMNHFKNLIWKFSKEKNISDMVSVQSAITDNHTVNVDNMVTDDPLDITDDSPLYDETEDVFADIREYIPYLTGEKKFSTKKISTDSAVNLMIFIKQNEKRMATSVSIPAYIKDNPNAMNAMYRLLQNLISYSDGEE